MNENLDVIIVDNGKIFRTEIFRRFLTEMDFDVKVFNNEKNTLVYLEDHSPHIAFIHFSEDMKRSIKFIETLYKKDPSICIIYQTAYHEDEVRLRALSAGAFRVYYKGLDNLELQTIHDIIELAKLESKKRKQHTSVKKRVFVIMPFAQKYYNTYIKAIKVPLEEIGMSCERLDEMYFTGIIINKLYKKIENSDLIIALLTGNNPNVYYEVGYAHALKKDVILLIQDSGNIPFDLKDHRHIIYGKGYKTLKYEIVKMVENIIKQ